MDAVVLEVDPKKLACRFNGSKWPFMIEVVPKSGDLAALQCRAQVQQGYASLLRARVINASEVPIRPEALLPDDLERFDRRHEIGLLDLDRHWLRRHLLARKADQPT